MERTHSTKVTITMDLAQAERLDRIMVALHDWGFSHKSGVDDEWLLQKLRRLDTAKAAYDHIQPHDVNVGDLRVEINNCAAR